MLRQVKALGSKCVAGERGCHGGGGGGGGAMIPMDELGPDGYSTIDQREKDCKYKGSDVSSDLAEREPLKNDTSRKHYIRSNRPAVSLVDACDVKPQPVDSWV